MPSGHEIRQALAGVDKKMAHLDLDKIISEGLDFIHERLGAARVSVALREIDPNGFKIYDVRSDSKEMPAGHFLPFYSTVLSKVLQDNKALYRRDILGERTKYETDTSLLQKGFRSDFLVPLTLGGKCFGTLNSASSKIDGISEETRKILERIAPCFALALLNSQLFEALKEAHDQLGMQVEKRTVELKRTNEKLKGESAERELLEEALLESREKYRSMMEAMTDSTYMCSPDYRIVYMNSAMIKWLGGDFTGETCYRALHGLNEKCEWCVQEKVQGGNLAETVIVSPRDGRSYHVSHSPVFHADGSISKMTILRDITELKRAEEALRKARNELELRVKERTAELVETNERLNREIEERKRSEEKAKRSEATLMEAQRIARLGNWTWNIVTNELHWPDEIYRMFGLTPLEFGVTYEVFLNSVHPDDRQFVINAVDAALYHNKPYSIDHRIVLPDGTNRVVHEQAEITFDDNGKPIRMIGTVQDITERKQVEEALQQSEAQLRRLSSQLLEVQEGERKRIAGELHDSIGQSLTAIKFGLENALDRISRHGANESLKLLEALIPVAQQASEEVRKIHTNLRPSLLDDLGIILTISWFCREFKTVYSNVKIEKRIGIEERNVPENLKIVIFRVLQEAMNNISKHGKADFVRISLKEKNGRLEFLVEDNGRGFDVEHIRSMKTLKEGFGLTSMRERTELSGGSFAVESIPGAGTVVRALWPM